MLLCASLNGFDKHWQLLQSSQHIVNKYLCRGQASECVCVIMRVYTHNDISYRLIKRKAKEMPDPKTQASVSNATCYIRLQAAGHSPAAGPPPLAVAAAAAAPVNNFIQKLHIKCRRV